jgi:hypothetical protein
MKKKLTNPKVRIKTISRRKSSPSTAKASGNKSKYAVPKIDPEEKLRRINKIRSRVCAFMDKVKTPTKEIMLIKSTDENA